MLALQAVLPTGEIIRTGSKAVKNVVGYDLTQLLVGSEGTLAILTEITLRLIPKPSARGHAAGRVSRRIRGSGRACPALIEARVVPATIEIIDGGSLRAVEKHLQRSVAPPGTGAMLIIEVDGVPAGVDEELALVANACERAGALSVQRASTEAGAQRVVGGAPRACRSRFAPPRRARSITTSSVPRGRVPQLFALIGRLERELDLWMPSFGHAGDGNIHVNIMVEPG